MKEYFDLTEEECDILTSIDVGEGLLIIQDERIPIRFEPTQLEHDVIKGKFRGEKKAAIASGFVIYPELQKLCDEHKIIFADWCTGDPSKLFDQGYERRQIQKVAGNGKMTVYVPVGMVDSKEMIDLPGIGKMSFVHYYSVLQIASLLILNGYQNVRINHSDKVDVEAEKEGKKIAFEYETNVHNGNELVKKLERALATYDITRFICSSTDAKFIKKHVGKYLITRGDVVMTFITNPFDGSTKAEAGAAFSEDLDEIEESDENQGDTELVNQARETSLISEIAA